MKLAKTISQNILLSAAVISLTTVTIKAELVVNGEKVSSASASQAVAATYTPDIASNDLIDVSQPSLASWTKDKTPYFESTTLNDGIGMPVTGSTLGTYMSATFGTKGKMPFTYTFNLDVSSNYTQSYDVVEIRSYAGWNENGPTLANQEYELLVSTIDTTNFISMGTFSYTPFASTDTDRGCASKMVLTESGGGAITTAVDALRFVFLDHGIHAGGVDGTVYYEVDVIGAPVEPYLYPVSYVYDGSGQGSQPSTDPAWPDNGGVELINGILPANAHYTDAQWVGFLVNPADDEICHPQVTFDLGQKYVLNQTDITYFHSTSQAGGTVTSPESVWVSVSNDSVSWSTPVEKTGFDGSSGDEIRTTGIALDGVIGRYVRLDFRNTSPWTFLGEIAFEGREPVKGALILVL